MSRNGRRYYTLVQHSAYGYDNHPGWAHAVEKASVDAADARSIVEAGGVIFTSYTEASNAAYEINYPASNSGIYPTAQGGFARKKVSGLALYTPCVDDPVESDPAPTNTRSQHPIVMRATCACGWEYGPSLQTDVINMVRFHQSHSTNDVQSVSNIHQVRYAAKCDCGWAVHDVASTPARKAAADHRAGRDFKVTA